MQEASASGDESDNDVYDAALALQQGGVVQRQARRIHPTGQPFEKVEQFGEKRVNRGLVDQLPVQRVAEILQQQKPPALVLGQDFRRAIAAASQMPGDPREGSDIFLRRRRIHQYRGFAPAGNAVVAPEGCIGGQNVTIRLIPSGFFQKRRDMNIALRHL